MPRAATSISSRPAGDLRLFALTATGDAFVTVDAGNLVNVNTNVVQDDRTVDQLRAGAWSELALTGTAAQAKIQATLTEYQLYQEQQYKTYWKYSGQLVGGVVMLSSAEVTYYSGIYGAQADQLQLTGQDKTDYITNAIHTLELSETQQYFNLQAKFGVGGSYAAFIASGANKYDPTLGIDVTGAIYDPATYNPNFTYLLTDNTDPAAPGEKQTLSAGIKVWTEDELINAIGAGLLKTVTSTEVNTVVNITAQKITLTVGGNVGTIDNPVTDLVGFSTAVKPVIVDPATQLALGAAERSDLNFLTVAPVTATVNFIVDGTGVGSMVRTDGGVWNPSVFKVGQAVYIGGNSGNATEGGVYQTIASITAATATQGATITFVKGAAPAIQAEFGRTILTAPVVTNLDTVDNSTHTTPLATDVSFGNINNNGTITLASGTWDTNLYKAGGGIFIASAGSPADPNANAPGTYYTIASVSGAVITLKWGQVLTPEGDTAHPVTVDLAPETISISSGASNVGFVLISTSRDIGIQASGAVKATASGFIFLGSPGDVQVDQIKAGTAGNNPTGADVRLKVQGQITDIASVHAAENATLTDATVTFANVANSGTITRVDGGTWAGYTVGQGIVIGGTKLVTVAAGDDVLIAQGYDSAKGTAGHYYQYTGATASLDLANTNYKTGPWVDLGTLKFTSQGSGGPTNSQSVSQGDVVQVSQGYDSTKGVAGNLYAYKGTTATLDLASTNYADTSKWTNLGAPKLDTQPTGGGYYTIVAIDATQKIITLKGGQLLTPESNVAIKVAAFAPVVNIEGASLVLEAGQAQIGTAAAPINIEILGTGTFTARALNDIFVNAIGNIPVDGIYSASAGVHLAATGSIYDAIASQFAKIQGTSIELQVYGANSTIGQDLLHPLHVDIVSQGVLQAIAGGNIAIDQSQGDLYVLDVLSKSGDVALGAQGFLFNGGNLVDPTKLDSGLAIGNAEANVRGNTILLNPDATSPTTLWTTTVGGIGSASASFNIISAYSGAGTLSAIAGNQDIYVVQTSGDVSLMSISSGSAQVAFITALAGSILNGRPDENAIVKAGKADLIASGSVGSGNLRNGLSGRIVSTVGNVEAIATTGSIWLWNKGALTVGGVVPVATSPYAMYAPNGSVNIQTSSPVTVILDNLSAGDILYQAGTAGASDDNLTVNSGVTLHSTGGSIELDAGNNVTVQAGAVIQAAIGITIRGAYLQPTATFLDPYLASAPVAAEVDFGNDGNNGTITLTNGGTWAALGYSVGGGIYVQSASDPNGNGASFSAGSYYTIAAINGATITLKSGQVLTSESNVTLDFAPVVTGSTVDLAGSFTAPTLTVLTGSGSDDIELHPAVLAADTFVATGAGDDLIHLYAMPTITAANNSVVDTVHLDGQDGADTYVVDTTGDTNYIVSVHDTGALDSGTNALIINGTGGADTFLVRPNLVAALEADGSGGYKQSYERINYDETITDRLTINGGNGDDSFFLDGNSAVMTLDGGAGKDSFQVGQMYATSAHRIGGRRPRGARRR